MWTIQTPSGLILYQDKYRKNCFAYVKQAIEKGADRNNLVLIKLKKEPKLVPMPGTEGNWGENHWGKED